MELVKSENGKLITSSLIIAEKFEKRHDHVLRAIENLDCSDGFRLLNFGESSYTNSQNKQMRCYVITEKGFMRLAMGFTGSKAAKWQEIFIDTFDKMKVLSDKKENGSLLSHQEIITLQEIIIAAFYKEYRDLAREKHLKTYLPNDPKGYDYANSQTQRNTVCGIDKYALEQRLKETNVKYANVEKALMQIDKLELIRIAVIDTMLHFDKSIEYARNVGDLAKEISKTRITHFDRVKDTMFVIPIQFNKTISLLQLNK